MSKSYTSSTASFVLAAAIVLATWLPTVSTPSAQPQTARELAPAQKTTA